MAIPRINNLLHFAVECTLLTISNTCSVHLDDDADAIVVVLSRDLLFKENVLVFPEFIQLNPLCKRP